MGALSAVLLVVALGATFAAAYASARVVVGLHADAQGFVQQLEKTVQAVCVHFQTATSRLPVTDALVQARQAAREHKRAMELHAGMPDALRLLGSALDSGSSLIKALDYAARNCSEPISGELKRAVWDLEAGQGFDEAMEKLRSRTGGSEFAYLAVAMEIQHKSGGSLNDVLASVASALRQTAELDDELKTKTSQGRLSARVVACMPIVLLIVLSVLTPGYFTQFFTSPVGLMLFVSALLLELAGIFLVRKTLSIDLSSQLRGGS